MKPETPIEEIWRIRDQLGAEENYDVHLLFERLRRQQRDYANRLVQPPLRRAPSKPAVALREEPPSYGEQSGGDQPRGGEKTNKQENPIEEVRRIREEISAECGHDVHRLFERLKALEAEHKDRLVSFAPRTPVGPVKKKRAARPK